MHTPRWAMVSWLRIVAVQLAAIHFIGYGQTQWIAGTSLQQSSEYYSLAFGKNVFVAVIGNGKIFISSSGIDYWVERPNPAKNPLYCVTYANNLFVAIGETGTIITSPDGIDWTKRTSGSSATLVTVSYGKGMFITVGSGGTILTSEDGAAWIRRQCDVTGFLNGVEYGNDKFVVCGDYNEVDSMSVILTSSDGINWTRQHSGVQTTIWPIVYAEGLFVAANNSWYRTSKNGVVILYSSDGIEWKKISGQTNYLQDIVYGNGRFVAVGQKGTIITSEDAKTWTKQSSPDTAKWITGIAYGNDRFVAMAWGGIPLVSFADRTIAGQPQTIDSRSSSQRFTIAANGTAMRLTIPAWMTQRDFTMACFSASGQKVFSRDIHAPAEVLTVPVAGLPCGYYLMTLNGGATMMSTPFTIDGRGRR